MTAPWGEESTAGACRDPRPTPLGQAGVKSPVPRPLPRPRILHLDTDATKPTRISELQQRFPLAPLRRSLPGRTGGCSSPDGDGRGLGDSSTHRHECPQGEEGTGRGFIPLERRQRRNGGGEGGRVCPGAGEAWDCGRGAARGPGWCLPHGPRYRGSFLRLPGAGSGHRSHAGGREAPALGSRQPSGLGFCLAPPGKGGSRLQNCGPGESLGLPDAAPSAPGKVRNPCEAPALGPTFLWDRWDTTAATCRFPLPRAGAAGEELRWL